MKKTKLRNPKIKKIDLVPAGAQQFSNIDIKKSKEDNTMSNLSVDKLEKLDSLLTALQALLEQEAEEPNHADIKEELEEAAASTIKEDCSNNEDNKEANNETEKAVECADNSGSDASSVEVKTEKECNKQDADPDIKKSVNEDVVKLAEDNKRLQDEIKKMRDAELKKSFVAKAADLNMLPGIKEDELGEILLNIYKSNSSDYARLENILKSANEVIKQGGLFNEYGTDAPGSTDIAKDEAWGTLQKMASDKAKELNISVEKGMTEVLKSAEGQRLYKIYENR